MLRFFLLLLCINSFNISAQEILRGEVKVSIEQIHSGEYVDQKYPLDARTLYFRALTESAYFYSAMIYGWSFTYNIGERARGIAETFELEPLGNIPFGDSGLFATDTQFQDKTLHLWTDYKLNEDQKRRVKMWQSGNLRTIQATGRVELGNPTKEDDWDWINIKKIALEITKTTRRLANLYDKTDVFHVPRTQVSLKKSHEKI